MVDFNKIMSGLAQSGVASGLVGGLAGGALTGALTSKRGRKTATSLLKIGGNTAVHASTIRMATQTGNSEQEIQGTHHFDRF